MRRVLGGNLVPGSADKAIPKRLGPIRISPNVFCHLDR